MGIGPLACKEVTELAHPYIDGELETDEQAEFDAHVAGCATCRDHIAFEASFKFLIPGTFSVSIAGPVGVTFSTSPDAPVTVELGSGKDLTQSFTLTDAQAE